MANRFRQHFGPVGERAQLAFVSLDFCDAVFRICAESDSFGVDESLALLAVRNEAIETLQEAGFLTQ